MRLVIIFFVLLTSSSLSIGAKSRGSGRTSSNFKPNATSFDGSKRGGKVFSLFNIVTFVNAPCASNSVLSGSQRRNGTCLTSTECSDVSGTASGNCAAGFGVCCLFIISSTTGGTINQNCTYIQNPGFPSAYTDTASITYTINKCQNDICDLRLDFETFTTVANGVTTETGGGVCTDTFTVAATGSVTSTPPICGQNTGQHVYVDIGNQGSDTATLTFAFTGSSTVRMWEIKVSQIECTSMTQPPDGCTQFHTGLTGRVTSFNFIPTSGETHLLDQNYSVCVRQEDGFCCIQWSVCADANSFTLDTDNMGGTIGGGNCNMDYVIVEGATGTVCDQGGTSTVIPRYCGDNFNPTIGATVNVPICDCNQPFSLTVVTDILPDSGMAATVNTMSGRGLCLEYTQVACNA